MKLNVNELKKKLLNTEITFMELDNYMMSNGYYSVFTDGDEVIADVKESKNVVYTAMDTNECEIKISFEITIDNGADEIISAFEMKIKEVEKF